MGINITHTMSNSHFENKNELRETAKRILEKKGTSSEATQKILEKSVFDIDSFQRGNYNSIPTHSQLTLDNSLKETLKSLKTRNFKAETKKPVLGELWELAKTKENKYTGELIDFEIDKNIENIFAA